MKSPTYKKCVIEVEMIKHKCKSEQIDNITMAIEKLVLLKTKRQDNYTLKSTRLAKSDMLCLFSS